MNATSVSIIIAAVLVGGAFMLTQRTGAPNAPSAPSANNVSIVDGQQIIDIQARGGYTPRTSVAKAGIPTIIRFHTNGTFDCSSFVRIPSMNVSSRLPSTGTTDIAVADPKTGTLQGMCGMGMYPFEVNFQ
ncbi:MAG: cupredoxin domain-containing protein [bacterium]|nr:cupredoxin domain-containing protein [bacterium]